MSQDDTLRRWRNVVVELATEQGISQRQLAMQAGISRSALRKMMKPNPSEFRLSCLEKVLRVLGHEIDAFSVREQ